MKTKYTFLILKFLFLVSIKTVVLGGDIELKECPPEHRPNVTKLFMEKLRLEDCNEQPCTVIKGRTYKIQGKSRFDYQTKKLILRVYGTIAPHPTAFLFEINVCHLIKKDACTNLIPRSTLEQETDYYVGKIFPSGQGALMFVLLDDSRVPVWCGELNVIIEKGA